MFGLGLPELVLILVIVLLIFGASRLPGIAKALKQSIDAFKKESKDKNEPKK